MKNKMMRTLSALTMMIMLVVLNAPAQTLKPGGPPMAPSPAPIQPVIPITPNPIQPGPGAVIPVTPNPIQPVIPVTPNPVQPNTIPTLPVPGMQNPAPPTPVAPLTSDIIKVPSKAQMDKGAKIEVIKAEDMQKAQAEQK